MKKEIVYQQVIEVGCGIDVHKDVIVATIRKNSKDYETREFNSFTSSLTDLKDWCKQEKVTHIAMESTGIYWKPVFNVLEDASFEIILVNARHVKNIPGHKTDKKDSAIAIISEIGVDMEQFPNEHHLASWSGVSPGNNESAGKKKAQEQSTGINTFKQP